MGSTQGCVSSVPVVLSVFGHPVRTSGLPSPRVRSSGTLGVHPLGSNRPELTRGLRLGTGLSVPTVLQTLHCAPPGLPGPCRLPVGGPCWSGQGTEVVICAGRAGPCLLTLCGHCTHCPCGLSSTRTLRPGALSMEEARDALWKAGDLATASQAVPAVFGDPSS